MELQTLIIIFLAFTAYAITPLSHNTINLRRFNMTNLMTSLGNQVIKILPSWCFKPQVITGRYKVSIKGWIARNGHSVPRQELIDLAISQDKMINEREDEIYEMQKEAPSIFNKHWYWITMYLLGIGTGAMGVFLYQVLQSTYNLV